MYLSSGKCLEFRKGTGRTCIRKLECCLEETGRSFHRVNDNIDVPWCAVSSHGAKSMGLFAVQAGVAYVCISYDLSLSAILNTTCTRESMQCVWGEVSTLVWPLSSK